MHPLESKGKRLRAAAGLIAMALPLKIDSSSESAMCWKIAALPMGSKPPAVNSSDH
jgi:hypothetical protein